MQAKQMEIIPKLRPIFTEKDRYDYFVMYGGRFSGKSHAMGDVVVKILEEEHGVRFLCIRDTATSLTDSAFKLIEDKIIQYGLSHKYAIRPSGKNGKGTIKNKITGSEVVFVGMQEHNATGVKSLEGFKYCWFEEAETMTENIFDILDPTIRMENSKIYLTFNPQRATDFVYDYFVNNTPDNVLVIKINYTDNHFLSDTARRKAEAMKKSDPEKYEWIYLGKPKASSDEQLISTKLIEEATERTISKENYKGLPICIGVDPAWTGSDNLVIVKRQGYYFEVLDVIPKVENTEDIGELILGYCKKFKTDNVFIDRGMGEGIYSYGKSRGRNWKLIAFHESPIGKDAKKYKRRKDQMWGRMKDWFVEGGVLNKECEYYSPLINELMNTNIKIIDYNMIQLESKSEYRKRNKGSSTDIADALALTFAKKDSSLQLNVQESKGYTKMKQWSVKI